MAKQRQGTRAVNRENTRRNLIAAVRHMLLSPGTDWTARNMVLTAVAERAGTSERTLFRYFDTKADLLLAACDVVPLHKVANGEGRIVDARLVSLVVEQDPSFVGAMVVHLAWGHLDLLEKAGATARDLILQGQDERFNL